MSWLKPDAVFAGSACLPEDCLGTRELDAPVGCKANAAETWCETVYWTNTTMSCDGECKYPAISDIGGQPLLKCADGATVAGGCPTQDTTVGPGTCCEGDIPPGSGGGGCGTTAPTSLQVDCNYSSSKIKFSWVPSSTPGDSQVVMVSDDYAAIFNNCGGLFVSDPKCIYKEKVPITQRSILLDKNKFDTSKIYYYKVMNFFDGQLSCNRSNLTQTRCDDCPQTAPSNLTVNCNLPGMLQLTWTKGEGPSTKQRVLIAEYPNFQAVVKNCVAPYENDCVVKNNQVDVNQEYYNLLKIFGWENKTYYWKVINVDGLFCTPKESQIYTSLCSCDVGVPTNLAINWNATVLNTQLTWTPGGGDDSKSQTVMVSKYKEAVENNCTGAPYAGQCSGANGYTKTGLGKNVASTLIPKNEFDSGTIYYFKVLNVADPTTCNKGSAVLTGLSSCEIDPVSIPDLEIGETRNASVGVETNSVISRINFTRGSAEISVSPAFVLGSNPPYQTGVRGVSAGDTTVTADVKVGANTVCSDDIDVTVLDTTPADAWWQAVSGNVHADNGGVTSLIPSTCTGLCLPYLITDTTGLLSFTGTADLGEGTINESGKEWQAKTVYKGTQTGFEYFKRLLADDPAGIGTWDGARPATNGVYLAEGDVTTSGNWMMATAKNYVLLVDGNVTVDNNINVIPGGFLAIIASGNITVADDVTNIEGVFISDGIFSSGGGNQQLVGEGIFTGWGGVNLGRVLADNSKTPAEKFVYRPDLMLNAYEYLSWMNISWREVAP